MALPMRVLNRLRLGGSIEAEVPASQAEYYAWVYIQPLVGISFQQARERWTLERCYQPFDLSPKGFFVRYIELSEWHLEWEDDIDYALEERRPMIDLQMCVWDEEALALLVSQWCHDFSTLRVPRSYPDPPTIY